MPAPRPTGMSRLVLPAVLAALLLAACGDGTTVGDSGPDLGGRSFVSTAVTGHDLVPGSQVRLGFQDGGGLAASAGCNSMGGTWSLDGDTLDARVTAMTEMACEEPLMAQDEWLSQWLASGLTASVDGDQLVLEGDGTTMELLDVEVAEPDQPIEGTTWVLEGIESGDAVSSVPEGVRATVRIEDGQLLVQTGCNSGSGPVSVDGDTLTVGPLATTKKACPPDAMSVEQAVLGVLAGTVTAQVEGSTLRLSNGSGGLDLRAA